MSEPEEYTCASCGGTFTKTWSDEEAIAEMHENFGPNMTVDQCEIICDDCYHFLGL